MGPSESACGQCAYPNPVPLLLATPWIIQEKNWKCLDIQAQGFPVALKDYVHRPNKFSLNSCSQCEGEGDVVSVKAPLGGVAQAIFHSVQVVEVGVQVRVHQDRGVENDGGGQVEVDREVGEDQGETLIMACG